MSQVLRSINIVRSVGKTKTVGSSNSTLNRSSSVRLNAPSLLRTSPNPNFVSLSPNGGGNSTMSVGQYSNKGQAFGLALPFAGLLLQYLLQDDDDGR